MDIPIVIRAIQGKDNVLEEQMSAAIRLATDRTNMFHEDKAAADGLCRPKKEKSTKKDLSRICHITHIYPPHARLFELQLVTFFNKSLQLCLFSERLIAQT